MRKTRKLRYGEEMINRKDEKGYWSQIEEGT